MEGRVRVSRGSDEVHVEQPQPTMGMPMLVPLPSTVMVAARPTLLPRAYRRPLPRGAAPG